MDPKYYDIILVGSGMSSLYSAYNIKKMNPSLSFLILEKYKKTWIGGRTSNDIFYGTEVVTGAGIGRRKKDKLLYGLLKELNLKTSEYEVEPHYSTQFEPLNVKKVMSYLRNQYDEDKDRCKTFETFAKSILGEKTYKRFLLSAGYTDYQNEDAYETLYYYGMDDNACCWTAFHVPWKKMVHTLERKIGAKHFKFSCQVTKIHRTNKNPCNFIITTNKPDISFSCNKVIVGVTVDSLRKIFPTHPIYNDVVGQPFMRLYGKFDRKSTEIMGEYVKGFTFVPGPLQRIIPMNRNDGVYMIAYNDNANTLALKSHIENTIENRQLFARLLEKSLGIPGNTLKLTAIKPYYWPIGTHYYKPLNYDLYEDRADFVNKAQHPEEGILVVGEAVSRNQGWTEGALESVKKVLTKKWVNNIFYCNK